MQKKYHHLLAHLHIGKVYAQPTRNLPHAHKPHHTKQQMAEHTVE